MAATRDPLDICLGAAYKLGVRAHRKDLAVASLREAASKDDELRAKMVERHARYAQVVSDPQRTCFIERVMHELLGSALSL